MEVCRLMKLSVRDINKTFVNNRVHTKVLEDISMEIELLYFKIMLYFLGKL